MGNIIGLKKVKLLNIWVFSNSKKTVQCVRGGGEGSGNIYFLKQIFTFLRIRIPEFDFEMSFQKLSIAVRAVENDGSPFPKLCCNFVFGTPSELLWISYFYVGDKKFTFPLAVTTIPCHDIWNALVYNHIPRAHILNHLKFSVCYRVGCLLV